MQKLPTGETEERVSIREPMKDLEDSNKELENEKRKLLEMLSNAFYRVVFFINVVSLNKVFWSS